MSEPTLEITALNELLARTGKQLDAARLSNALCGTLFNDICFALSPEDDPKEMQAYHCSLLISMIGQLRVDRETFLGKVAHLTRKIEDAPHEENCAYIVSLQASLTIPRGAVAECNCWKSRN